MFLCICNKNKNKSLNSTLKSENNKLNLFIIHKIPDHLFLLLPNLFCFERCAKKKHLDFILLTLRCLL